MKTVICFVLLLAVICMLQSSVFAAEYGSPDFLNDEISQFDDINNYAPQITITTLSAASPNTAEVSENVEMGTFIAHMSVTDDDVGPSGMVTCILNDDHFTLSQLFETEYKIVTTAMLDRESQAEYDLTLQCEDGGIEPQISIMHLQVVVTDINDHSPVFEKEIYSASLTENNPIGAFVTQVSATDQDIGSNSQIRYILSPDFPNSVSNWFQVNPDTGVIEASVSFDRELYSQIRFHVIAEDHGVTFKYGRALVIVTLQDENDEAPVFSMSAYSFAVFENEPIDTEVGTVIAVDADSLPLYNQFTYSLISGNDGDMFAIDFMNGVITTRTILDRETQDVYYVTAVASDDINPALSSTASVTISVADQDDKKPKFSESSYTFAVLENEPIGTEVGTVSAVDADSPPDNQFSYSLNGCAFDMFAIDPRSGVITTKTILDRETQDVYYVTAVASDDSSPALSSTASVTISVADQDDEKTKFSESSYTFAALENEPIGTEVGTVSAVDADSPPYNQFSYSLNGCAFDMFAIDPRSGIITTKKILDRDGQDVYYVTVIANDNSGPALSGTASVSIYVAG